MPRPPSSWDDQPTSPPHSTYNSSSRGPFMPPIPSRQLPWSHPNLAPGMTPSNNSHSGSTGSNGHSRSHSNGQSNGDEDDGGWTVDRDSRSYTERKARKNKREREHSNTFGIMHGVSSLSFNREVIKEEPQEVDSLTSNAPKPSAAATSTPPPLPLQAAQSPPKERPPYIQESMSENEPRHIPFYAPPDVKTNHPSDDEYGAGGWEPAADPSAITSVYGPPVFALDDRPPQPQSRASVLGQSSIANWLNDTRGRAVSRDHSTISGNASVPSAHATVFEPKQQVVAAAPKVVETPFIPAPSGQTQVADVDLSNQDRPLQSLPTSLPAPPKDPLNPSATHQEHYTSIESPLGQAYGGPINHNAEYRAFPSFNDPNRMTVQNPKQWGATQPPSREAPDPMDQQAAPTPASQLLPPGDTISRIPSSSTLTDGGWGQESGVSRWIKNVEPNAPPEVSSPPPPSHISLGDRPTPTSNIPVEHPSIKPADVSDSGSDPSLPTPRGKSKAPPILAVDLGGREVGRDSPRHGSRRAPTVISHPTPSLREDRNGRAMWKRPPHPAFSAHFMHQRIMIKLPYPVRLDALKFMIGDSMSRYGTTRCIWLHEPQGDSCDTVLVVFDEPESVQRCLSDPGRDTLISRASNQAGDTEIKIDISVPPAKMLSKVVFIKVTGPRWDTRSRSASPKRREDGTERFHREVQDWNTAPLPPVAHIDIVPHMKRGSNRIDHYARIRADHMDFDLVNSRALTETNVPARHIASVRLDRRIPEKDFIPRLCEYFADIIDMVPPTSAEQGWLVTVAGPLDARVLMTELAKISGITVRWATKDDGDFQRAPSERAVPGLVGFSREELPPPEPRYASLSNSATSTSSSDTQVKMEPLTPRQEESPIFANVNTPNGMHDPTYPHLRRFLVHTYRGRTLREDMTTGEPRYFDDSAIFVGKLVKQHETVQTLFERFARYGNIVDIEYKPGALNGCTTSARILYQEPTAAQRAIQFENGAVSFGSLIKVDQRKVLPSDLQEKLVDDFGRAYSPSMASQYSPPNMPREADCTFVQPPPMSTHTPPIQFAPPLNMYHGPGHWVPFNNAQSNDVPLYPVLFAMGIGRYAPPGAPQGMPPMYLAPMPPSYPNDSNGSPGPAMTPAPPVPPTFSQFKGPVATPQTIPAPPTIPPVPQQSTNASPKIAEVKEENGMLWVVYDEQDLKRYCQDTKQPLPAKVRVALSPTDKSASPPKNDSPVAVAPNVPTPMGPASDGRRMSMPPPQLPHNAPPWTSDALRGPRSDYTSPAPRLFALPIPFQTSTPAQFRQSSPPRSNRFAGPSPNLTLQPPASPVHPEHPASSSHMSLNGQAYPIKGPWDAQPGNGGNRSEVASQMNTSASNTITPPRQEALNGIPGVGPDGWLLQ